MLNSVFYRAHDFIIDKIYLASNAFYEGPFVPGEFTVLFGGQTNGRNLENKQLARPANAIDQLVHLFFERRKNAFPFSLSSILIRLLRFPLVSLRFPFPDYIDSQSPLFIRLFFEEKRERCVSPSTKIKHLGNEVMVVCKFLFAIRLLFCIIAICSKLWSNRFHLGQKCRREEWPLENKTSSRLLIIRILQPLFVNVLRRAGNWFSRDR